MVRRKLFSTLVARSLFKANRPLSQPAVQHFTPEQSRTNLKYIDERVNNVFNIILAEINSKNTHPSLAKAAGTGTHLPNNVIYKDPYNFKDRILQDLVSNHDINQNYNIHDLIEEEFQLEISDQEFQQFKSLKDIVNYVNQRLEIKSMFPYDSGHSSSNINY